MDNEQREGIRINRYLAQAGQGSRRNVETLVLQRRVQIDGDVVTNLGARVHAGQTVRVDGTVVYPSRETVVFALNKPVKVLVSNSDPEGRPLAIDIVRPFYSGRLLAVGRLDFMSSGLLLFTNDGDLAQQLMRPDTAIDREYVVETEEPIPAEVLESFRRGLKIEGVTYRLERYQRHSARRISLILREGRNREIRRVFAHFRIRVGRIYRNRYGTVRLGNLPEGHVRRLTAEEVRALTTAIKKGIGHGRRH